MARDYESPLLFLFLFLSLVSSLSSRGSREFISSLSFQKKNDTLSASARAHAHAHTRKKRVTLKRRRVKAYYYYYYERENVESGIEQSRYTTSEKETKRDFISLERKDEQGRNEFSGKTHPKGTGGNQFGTTDEL